MSDSLSGLSSFQFEADDDEEPVAKKMKPSAVSMKNHLTMLRLDSAWESLSHAEA